MLRPDGYVKVLDFGIAKLSEGGAEGGAAQTTDGALRTGTGAVVGTVAYMSPEQALGRDVDQRTDVFSLGVVIYEMFAGRHPFRGDTPAATFDAILNRDPKTPALPGLEISEELGRVVCRALEKDRELRYQTASDLRADLKRLMRALDSSPSAPGAPVSGAGLKRRAAAAKRPRARLIAALAALALVFMGVAAVAYFARRGNSASGASAPRTPPDIKFSQLTDQAGEELTPTLSPDGKEVAYASRASGNWDIYLLRVGGNKPRNLTADSAADERHPAFSPDGARVAFRSERDRGGVFLMGATGESVRRLTDFGYFPAWSPDGKRLAVSTQEFDNPNSRRLDPSMIWVVDAQTGEKRQLTTEANGDAAQPSWSPGGARVVYWGKHQGGRRDLWTVAADGGEPVQLTDDDPFDWNPVWSADGHVYFSSDRGGSMNLWRVPVDERTGRASGPPQPITTPAPYAMHLAFSRDGRRAVFVSRTGTSHIVKSDFKPLQGNLHRPARLRHAGLPARGLARPVARRRVDSLRREDRRPRRHLCHRQGRGGRAAPAHRRHPQRPRAPLVAGREPRHLLLGPQRQVRGVVGRLRRQQPPAAHLHGGAGVAYPFFSPDGRRLAYNRAGESVSIIDANVAWGEQTPLRVEDPPDRRLGNFWASSWSPDGRKLGGWTIGPGVTQAGVVVYDMEKKTFTRVTDFGTAPQWLQDSRRLIFIHDGKIFLVDAETRRLRELLAPAPLIAGTTKLSKDGRKIFYLLSTIEADLCLLDFG
jgi:Tol biopolymer transport system component